MATLLLSYDIVSIMLRHLNERDRLRLLVTTKAFAHWLLERRKVAQYTFERIVGTYQSDGSRRFNTKHTYDDGYKCFKAHFVRLDPNDRGLLHVQTFWSNIMFTTPMTYLDSGSDEWFYSPWMASIVYANKHNDRKGDEACDRLHRSYTELLDDDY